MTGDPVVVDASALAAILFGEPEGEAVAARIGDRDMVAPGLIRYELANVCSKKIRAYPGQRRALFGSLAMIDQLRLHELPVDLEAVLVLAERHRLTAYDASYLSVALELGLELVTLDAELDQAAGRAGWE